MQPPNKNKMFGWYDPPALLRTGVDVAFSTIFGRHSDARLIEAVTMPAAPGVNTSAPFNYTVEYTNGPGDTPREVPNQPREEIWIDYVADVGDGWDSTYAVAYYISQNLTFKDSTGKTHETERGAVMVMGGDQVYPSANRDRYNNQLLRPYAAALEKTPNPNHYPHLFVVPGNHDWYDSLSSFTRMFCEQRWFGAWKTRQHRSYFALKLPQRWWLIGTDVQLASDIDDAQVKYFREIADHHMQPDDRIILCNAEPHWIYAHIYGQDDTNYRDNNLAYLELKIFQKQTISAFIAGDLHHYRRHECEDKGKQIQKITAGGGGAFLHPTHGPDVQKMEEAEVDVRKTAARRVFECKKSFPEMDDSKRICRRNWKFLFLNPLFGLLTGTLYLFTAWAIMAPLHNFDLSQWCLALQQTLVSAMTNQTGALWVVTVLAGLVFFTDTHSPVYRFVAGPIHGLSHLTVIFATGWAIDHYLAVSTLGKVSPPAHGTVWTLTLAAGIMFATGWIVGSEIMGVYLWISLNFFKRHQNEAFSSLHIPDYKNFLRLHISKDGKLTIFPVGIKTVPKNWEKVESDGTSPAYIPDDTNATVPVLIEDPFGPDDQK